MEAKLGDNVLISPEVTHKSEWTQGTVIDVEQDINKVELVKN